MKLGEILVAAGKARPGQISDALAQQASGDDRKLGELLVAAGVVNPVDVLEALGRQFHLPVIAGIADHMIDPALIARIPVDWAREHLVLPVRHDGAVVAVMADPAALPRLEEITLLTGEEVSGLLAPAVAVQRAIDHAYFEHKREAPVAERRPSAEAYTAAPTRADDLLRVADSAPVTQLVNTIILDAVRKKASDVHIEPYENHLRIRFRIDGFLYDQPAPLKHLESSLISRIKVMSKLDISERRLPQDGMAKVRAGEREIDIRVSTVPVAEGERVALRLLNQASTLLPLSELGMPPNILERFRLLMAAPNGIILVTGPTGSGKTTTLYAALQEMDTQHRNILTIEDPIEYQIPNIGQIQVKPKIGLTFAAGLRHVLRQDPDVILVGEIRDQETAEIAIRSALTGHTVLSTLHTNDAVSAVVRLADMGVAPYLIGSSVRGILAQRLVRRLCPACRVSDALDPAMVAALGPEAVRHLAGRSGYRAAGCSSCMQGYRGRIGLYELLVVGPHVQEAIRRGADSAALRALAGGQSRSMAVDAAGKLVDGLTSLDEVLRVIEPVAPERAP